MLPVMSVLPTMVLRVHATLLAQNKKKWWKAQGAHQPYGHPRKGYGQMRLRLPAKVNRQPLDVPDRLRVQRALIKLSRRRAEQRLLPIRLGLLCRRHPLLSRHRQPLNGGCHSTVG